MIAGLLKAPSRFSPSANPERAAKRAETVIKAMIDGGFLEENFDDTEVAALPDKEYSRAGIGSMRYFGDWIIGQLPSYTQNTNQDLIIQTTLDPDLQKYTAQRINDYLEESGEERNISQAAVVTMQPDGRVVTMIGGRDYKTSQFNRAVQAKRQPGSAFKPIIYLTGLEKAALEPESVVIDEPIQINGYKPENFGQEYRGAITIQHGLSESLNTVAVQILDHVGVKTTQEMALSLGITDRLNNDLSMALGTSETSLLTMTSAYSVFANNGNSVQPYGIKEIRTSDGKLLYRHEQYPSSAIVSSESIAKLNMMLQSVVQYGTGQNARLDRPAAGKTGTSQDYRDAWFIGYTPSYITGVWLGNDDNRSMKRVTGGSIPARLWRDVMRHAHKNIPTEYLPGALPRHYLDQRIRPDTQPDVFRHRFSKIGNEAEDAALEAKLIEERERKKRGFSHFLNRIIRRDKGGRSQRENNPSPDHFFYRKD